MKSELGPHIKRTPSIKGGGESFLTTDLEHLERFAVQNGEFHMTERFLWKKNYAACVTSASPKPHVKIFNEKRKNVNFSYESEITKPSCNHCYMYSISVNTGVYHLKMFMILRTNFCFPWSFEKSGFNYSSFINPYVPLSTVDVLIDIEFDFYFEFRCLVS